MKPSSYHNYDKSPSLPIAGYAAWEGYDAIAKTLLSDLAGKSSCVIVLDCYPEVDQAEVEAGLSSLGAVFYHTDACMMPKEDYKALIQPYVTDDRVFGVMNPLTLRDILQEDKAEAMRAAIRQERQKKNGIICVIGVGASLVTSGDILVYLDLARWEIQCRFQKGAPNWHTDNERAGKLIKFKQGYFVEWRMADRHKRTLLQ